MNHEPKQNIEYFYKRATYIFPNNTKIFLNGNKLLVEIDDKKTRDLSNYLSKKNNLNREYNNRVGLAITGNGSELIEEYQIIADYFDTHHRFNFLDFEYATSNELVLCTFFKPLDFNWMRSSIEDIHKHLPFLINIFRRPYIHLKEKEILQSVDTAMRINHKTINHLSKHSELWRTYDSKKGSVEPDKLLTKVYVDDYSIYENVVFYNLVNKIFSFLSKTIYYLTDILDTFNESIKLDAVNRFNHQMYYLSIGKLYIGFYNMEDTTEVSSILEAAKNLYRQLNRYKVREVYTSNINTKPLNGEIKKTNLFAMHKDYKHVYTLYKKFKNKSLSNNDNGTDLKQVKSQYTYEIFSQMLALFAISNFNFKSYSLEDIYNNGKVNAEFSFKNWGLKVFTQYNYVLGFNTIVLNLAYNNQKINYLIIPMGYYIPIDRKKQYEIIIERLYNIGEEYDKYIFFEPFDYDNTLYSYSMSYKNGFDNIFYAVLPISISEINSFRRVQKLLLEAMILSNQENDICAFCGSGLQKEADNHYVCNKCRTVIKNIHCEHCDRDFVASYFDVKTRKKKRAESYEGLPEFYKQERQYLFRNIVKITKNGYVCPHCSNETIETKMEESHEKS